jgi:hypothetical protein
MISKDLLDMAKDLEKKAAKWPKMSPEAAPLAAVSEACAILRDAASYTAIPTKTANPR